MLPKAARVPQTRCPQAMQASYHPHLLLRLVFIALKFCLPQSSRIHCSLRFLSTHHPTLPLPSQPGHFTDNCAAPRPSYATHRNGSFGMKRSMRRGLPQPLARVLLLTQRLDGGVKLTLQVCISFKLTFELRRLREGLLTYGREFGLKLFGSCSESYLPRCSCHQLLAASRQC